MIRRMLFMLGRHFARVRDFVSPQRTDRVTLDELRTTRSVRRADAAIAQLEHDSVLRRRVQLMERRMSEKPPERLGNS